MDMLRRAAICCDWSARLCGLFAVLWTLSLTSAAMATPGPSRLCDQAALTASEVTGVPANVLQAITRTETGRAIGGVLAPWPWTVNLEGKGHWFATEDEAKLFVFKAFKSGARSFDVGCFQINYRWHGHAFRTIEDMFDPRMNAEYAAEFLANLHREFGNWSAAAGAYHSRTEQHATRYSARFDQILGNLPTAADHHDKDQRTVMVKQQSLLRSQSAGRPVLGSLMPVTTEMPVFIAMQPRGRVK